MQNGRVAVNAVAFIAILSLFFSCASAPKKESPAKVEEQYVPDTTEAVSIPIPKKTSRSYFSSINKNVLDLVETGSPESLKQAVSLLRKTNVEEYQENEKVLMNICAELMKIVWPSQNVSWDVPEVTVSTPYLGAIDSARRGVYDLSTGNTDFLTLVLPSLVLITSNARSDYYTESNAALVTALQMRPDSVLANYLMGVLKRRNGTPEESLSYFREAVDLFPDCFETQYAQAEAFRLAGNNKTALEKGETLLLSYQQNVELLELCAETSYSLGDSAKAEQYVVRVLLLEPDNSRYVLFRARILMDKGDYIKASSLLDIYARTNNTAKDYLLLRARLQRDWNKNNIAAGATIEQALSLYPDDEEVLLFAAQLASSANNKIGGRDALSFANQILEKDKTNFDALVISMKEEQKNGDYQSAYAVSSVLVQHKDCPAEIYYMHVEICLSLNKREEANRIASSLYMASPADESAQQLYLKVLVAFGRKIEGMRLIENLMPNANAKMKSFLLYERSYFQTSEDDMLGDLRSSLTSNPRNRDALYRLYEIYYAKKDWRKAQYYLKQVVALNPADASLLKQNAELDSLLNK